MGTQRKIGVLCNQDLPVFAEVADRLREREYGVQLFEPQANLAAADVDELSLVVNKQVFPHNLAPLWHARRTGTPV